jgi:WD40 repeat protein
MDATPGHGHRGSVNALVVAPGGKRVGSEGADGTIRLWEATTGREECKFRVPAGTTCAAFAPDGRTVALGHQDGTIGLHETATGQERRLLKGHPNGVGFLALSPDGKTLASRGRFDNLIRLQDVASGRELRQIAVPQLAPANAGGPAAMMLGTGYGAPGLGLAFSPDGRLLASQAANANLASAGGRPPGKRPDVALHVWDAPTGKEIRRIEMPVEDCDAGFAFSPDGRTLATANTDRTVTLWEVASGKERAHLGKPAGGPRPLNGDVFMVYTIGVGSVPVAGPTIAFAPDGRTVIARGPDQSIEVWDVATGKQMTRLTGQDGSVTVTALAPDGKWLASGSGDGPILVWDLTGARPQIGPGSAKLPARALESAWADLLGHDAVRAYQAVRRLAAAPGKAVPFLRTRVRPVLPADPPTLERLAADLASEKFRERERAVKGLEELTDLAVPALEKILAGKPALETRRRAEQLLARLTGLTLPPARLRLVRAVEVLEQAGTAEARQVLAALAHGAPEALATREAQAALDRLAKGPAGQP